MDKNRNAVKNKILIVSSSLDTGGAQKMISNITTNLPKEWESDILLNSGENIQFPYKGNIISLGIAEPKSRTSLLYQGRVLLKRLGILSQLKRKNSYKACISLLDSANIANIITGNKHCKVIITAIINMSEESHLKVYKYIVFPLIRLFYNRSDHIVAQNDAIKNDLIRNFGMKEELFTIIYNGIDVKAIEEICKTPLRPEEKEWFSKERTIVTAGRLAYAKGQWHLIRAFKKVLEEIPDARLVIFGIGELQEYLQRLIDHYQMQESAYIKGFDPQLDKYIASSAAFVFPSMLEGMPTALLEAMACGTASIVTDFKSGAREIMDYPLDRQVDSIVKTEYGIITPVCSGIYHEAEEPLEKNEEILADAMIEILRDPSYRNMYAEQGKRRSWQFDMPKLVKEWIAVVEK